MNRAHRRWASMTGRTPPSDEELTEQLRKRVLSVEGEDGLVKRFSRYGLPSRLKNNALKRTRAQNVQLDASDTKYVIDSVNNRKLLSSRLK
jgi:hypothetical protein